MGLLNSILSDTAGIAFRAATGKVDPWTVANQNEELAANIKQAMGPNASDADVAAAQNAAVNEQNNYLKSIGEHPDQAEGLHIPGLGDIGSPEFLEKLNTIVHGLLLVGAIGAVVYFTVQYKRLFGKAR